MCLVPMASLFMIKICRINSIYRIICPPRDDLINVYSKGVLLGVYGGEVN
jgi:hypothetical protein